jgi:hypothetical protein
MNISNAMLTAKAIWTLRPKFQRVAGLLNRYDDLPSAAKIDMIADAAGGVLDELGDTLERGGPDGVDAPMPWDAR